LSWWLSVHQTLRPPFRTYLLSFFLCAFLQKLCALLHFFAVRTHITRARATRIIISPADLLLRLGERVRPSLVDAVGYRAHLLYRAAERYRRGRIKLSTTGVLVCSHLGSGENRPLDQSRTRTLVGCYQMWIVAWTRA